MEDRLTHIKRLLKKNRVYYGRYSPRSDMLYEVDEADEDMAWLVYEVVRLREENEALLQRLGPAAREPEGRE